MKRHGRYSRSLVALSCVLAALNTCKTDKPPHGRGTAPPASESRDCLANLVSHTWRAEMQSSQPIYRLEGTIGTGSSGLAVRLEETTAEGTRDLLEFPADSLAGHGDSVRFLFAPVGILVQGACVEPKRIMVRFSRPNPPYPAIEGTGQLAR